jgi:hypothetical protein
LNPVNVEALEETTVWTVETAVVARSLRELERSGAIDAENRRIIIKDREVLQQWAQPWN